MVLVMSVFIVGCNPFEKPEDVVNEYYMSVADSKFDKAYNLFSKHTKDLYSKEDFVTLLNLEKEVVNLTGLKIDKSGTYKEKIIDGIKFNNVTEFEVVQKYIRIGSTEETSSTTVRNIVKENGKLRVYKEKFDAKKSISNNYCILGKMYASGEGKDKDTNQAVAMFKKSLEYNPESFDSIYGLAEVNYELKNYDESEKYANDYISKTKDFEKKSDAYILIGDIYLQREDYDNAGKYYNKAQAENYFNDAASERKKKLEEKTGKLY